MKRHVIRGVVLAALAVVPPVALAGSTTFSGKANNDPQARIKIVVTKQGGQREIRRVIVKRLPYAGGSCKGSGRTPRAVLGGSFEVANSGRFKAVGGAATQDPLDGGEIGVRGKIDGGKITGSMRYTYGKTGCRADKLRYTARR